MKINIEDAELIIGIIDDINNGNSYYNVTVKELIQLQRVKKELKKYIDNKDTNNVHFT